MRPAELGALGMLGGLALAVGLAFQEVFAGVPLVELTQVVLPSVVVGLASSFSLSRVRGWGTSSALLASAGLNLVVMVVAVWHTVPTPAALGTAVEALVNAPRQVLTVTLPAPGDPELLVLPAATAWAVAYVSAELALRRRTALLPLLPPAVGLVLPALLAGAEHARPDSGLLLVVTLGGGGLVLIRTLGQSGQPRAWPEPPPRTGGDVRRMRRRRAIATLPLVVLAGLVPVVLGERLPGAGASAPRFDLSDRPVGHELVLRNPLSEVSAQRDAETTVEMFTAQAPPGIELWRLVALDTYDGVRWEPSGEFVRAGERLPDQPASEHPASSAGTPGEAQPEPVSQAISLTGLDGPFLPVGGRPVEVHGVPVELGADGMSLRLADDGTPPGGDQSYDVRAVPTDRPDDELNLAVRDRSGEDAESASRQIDEVGLLADIAREQVEARRGLLSGSRDMRELRALEDFFADQGRFRLAEEPAGGVTLRHLSAFVVTAVNGGPSEGTVEQFAAAYAVMARTLGYPTRVVVGYRTPGTGAGGHYEVTNRDAFAWVEVKLEGFGWVPFVIGPVRTADDPPPLELPETTTTTVDPDAEPDETTETTSEAASGEGDEPGDDEDAGGGSGWTGRLVLAAVGLVLLGLVIVLAPVMVRLVRARRLARDGNVAGRVDGAWMHLTERLVAYRVPVARSMTVTEVLGTIERHFGGDLPGGAATLGGMVNRARFAPVLLPSQAAADAWRLSDEVLAWSRRQTTFGDRLKAWFTVR